MSIDLVLTHGYFLAEDERERKIMRPYPPLGILSITAYLQARGFSVEVADSTFRRQAEVGARLESEPPPVVGIYANLMTRPRVVELARVASAAGSVVVVGGPEPANYPAEYLAHGADVVVVGEGEETMAELLTALRAKGKHRLEDIDGIVFRNEDGEIVQTPPRLLAKDLDDYPDPARDAIDLDQYIRTWETYHGVRSVSLITSRGCPYTCTWCSHGVYGRSHRRRSVDRVVAEIEYLHERYSPDQLWFADDVFTIHAKWTRQFAEALSARGLQIPFECISRADRMDDEMCRVVAEMGCQKLWIGSESGSQRILDAMKRGVAVEAVQHVTRELQQYQVEVGMFLMWGYDGEDWDDVDATIDHVRRTQPDEFLTTVSYPIKGTPYYDAVESRAVLPGDWATSSDRDIDVTRRLSRRFYQLADRRMRTLVALDRARAGSGPGALLTTLALAGKAELWRWGMRASRRQPSR